LQCKSSGIPDEQNLKQFVDEMFDLVRGCV
jgi:hypothetical protein